MRCQQHRPACDPSRARLDIRSVGLSAMIAGAITGATLLATWSPAAAGIVPTVPLATASGYAVLAGTTVTNTNASVLDASVGLSPGSAIVGFPPGIVLPPGILDAASPTALQAQSDLTVAYVDAAGRSVEFTQTNPDLTGQTLIPGVYAATAKAPLGLTGQLVLDGQNDPNAVFVFQTDSTLITGTGSSVVLINGATECNVFWQVGSSATLGSGSVFVGNILALTSITVQSAVVVHGRALARNGAVTLDNDTFTQPTCATATPATTTTTTAATTTTAVATPSTGTPATNPDGTPATNPDGTPATNPDGTPATIPPGSGVGGGTPAAPVVTPSAGPGDLTGPFDGSTIVLPRTGAGPGRDLVIGATVSVLIGVMTVVAARRRRTAV